MRLLFVVGAKLLGIVYLSAFLTSLIALVNISQYDKGSLSCSSAYMVIIGYVLAVVINFIFSYLLLFRTSNIAKILKLENSEIKFGELSVKSVVHGGIVLIGIYIFTTSIGSFLNNLTFYLTMRTSDKNINLLGTRHQIFCQKTTIIDILINAIPIILSLLFIFKSGKMVKLINRDNKLN